VNQKDVPALFRIINKKTTSAKALGCASWSDVHISVAQSEVKLFPSFQLRDVVSERFLWMRNINDDGCLKDFQRSLDSFVKRLDASSDVCSKGAQGKFVEIETAA